MTEVRRFGLTDAERTRVEHIDKLFSLGAPSVGELIASISDASWTVRRAVVGALAALGEEAVAPLCTWLREVRSAEHAIAAAVDALVSSIGPIRWGALASLLDDPNPAVVADAVVILGRRRAHDAAPRLATLLEHPDDNVAVAAIEALGTIGGTIAVDALVGVVRSKRFFRTFPALQVLARTNDPRSVSPIAELLADAGFQTEAARALGRTGSLLAIAPLASLLSRPGDSIARLVATALADLSARAEWTGAHASVAAAMRAMLAPSLGRFVAALPGADGAERLAIAKLLGTIGEANTLAVLVGLLDDPETRAAATEAIRRIGALYNDALVDALERGSASTRLALLPIIGAASAVSRVRGLLADEDPEVRARACETLERTGDTATLPALFAALADPSPRVGHAATAAIFALGATSVSTLALEALGSTQAAMRRHALRIITFFRCHDTFDEVRAAIDDPDVRIAELAIGALGALADPGVEPVLVALARRPEEALRGATMRAASHRGGELMTTLLENGLADDAAWVRYYACQGLGRRAQGGSLPAIVACLADPSPHVRIAAIEALSRLGTPPAWQALVSAVGSSDPDEKRAALVGISRRDLPEAIPLLLEAARSDDVATRLIALAGLALATDVRAVEAIARAAGGPSGELRDAALSLLVEHRDRTAADALVDLALANEADHPAHFALSQASAVRIAAVAARLDAADDRVAPILAAALARMGGADAIAAMFDALAATSPSARGAVATALIAIDATGARALIDRLIEDDPDLDVRRACAAAVQGNLA